MCKSCPTTKNLTFFKEKVRLAIENDEDYKEGDLHQALLNLVYKEWEKPENINWDYLKLIKFAIKEYGEMVAFAVLIGKYNQQVCNGGHYQYYDNGYATGKGGYMTKHGNDTELHNLLLSYFLHDEDLSKYHWFGELKKILEKFLNFRIDEEQYETGECSECGGSGYVDVDSDDEDGDGEEEKCYTCNGSGEEDFENENYQSPIGHDWENLDDRYYEINEQVSKDLNEYFKLKLI